MTAHELVATCMHKFELRCTIAAIDGKLRHRRGSETLKGHPGVAVLAVTSCNEPEASIAQAVGCS